MKMLLFLFTLLALSFGVRDINAQPPLQNGWLHFTPSPDTRLIYVSDAQGNDATAQVYAPAAPEIGADPFNPAGAILPYKTIAAARAQLRNGYPDWILLKKGDTFTNQTFGVVSLSGRGRLEPLLIGTYGSACERPRVLTGANSFLVFTGASASNIAIQGLYAEPHTRAGTDEPIGVNLSLAPFNSVYIEDCHFHRFSGHLVAQDLTGSEPYAASNLVVRRNILTHAYRVGAGSHGVFAQRVDTILFEENLIDHNGWSETVAGAGPTGFSHNTYFQTNCRQLTFRRNIVSRASAVGGGHRCGGIIFDNLYLSNPRNILIGTFDAGALDWPTQYASGEISYNVVLDARPEPFDPGNGITVLRTSQANIHHNIVAHFTPAGGYNTGIGLDYVENVRLHHNLVYKWGNNMPAGIEYSTGIFVGSNLRGMNGVDSNDVQLENPKGYCISKAGTFANVAFRGNRYNNLNAPGQWFDPSGSYANWVAQSGETGSAATDVAYPDPERNIETYLASIGESGGLETLIELGKQQSKCDWDERFAAGMINDYIRSGFGITTSPVNSRPNNTLTVDCFPNPANVRLTIVSPVVLERITVFNSTGARVADYTSNTSRQELNISGLAEGIYFLKIEGAGDAVGFIRVVKAK